MLAQGRSRWVVSQKRVMIRLPYRDSKKMAEEMQGLTRVSCQEGVCIIQLSGCINGKKYSSVRATLSQRTSLQHDDPITPCKGIQDILGFWIPRCGFRIPGTGFQSWSVELGFWIPIVSGIPDSLGCIPDSKAQKSGFHKQKFHTFRNPDSLIWGEP